MPAVDVIDLRHEKGFLGGLSESFGRRCAGLSRNRAGDAAAQPAGLSHVCRLSELRHVVKCRDCDMAVTYHKGRHILICHTCDAERPCPDSCPACSAPHMHYGGIGTERLERDVKAFPAMRLAADGFRHDAEAGQP